MSVTIHCQPAIAWHEPFAKKMRQGLKKLGIESRTTACRFRESDTAILLGTSLWRNIERDGDFLLVDRCSFGDTNEWVSLVWNGHGRRGDHRVPDTFTPERWDALGHYVHPWKLGGERVVLCGQTESYSPQYATVADWYDDCAATHFRKHPAGDNPTGLPLATDWQNCKAAITLNSSVGVDAVMHGVPTITMDEGAMAWDITGHDPNDLDSTKLTDDRREWLAWLAWTQWHHSEIRDGEPIRHLFEAI